MTEWWGATGKVADRALREDQRDMSATNCITESIRMSACEPQGMPHLQIPPTGPQAPIALHRLHSHIPPLQEWFFMYVPNSCKNQPLKVASEHTQKAEPALWTWEK